MIQILIVDDEELARHKIKRFLAESQIQATITEAANGLQALQILSTSSIDLVFLDIDMPGLTGLEVLQNLEQRPFKVIFQTASDAFAIRAFEENACDYLLKPFDRERFQSALQKALARVETDRKLQGFEKQMRQAQF